MLGIDFKNRFTGGLNDSVRAITPPLPALPKTEKTALSIDKKLEDKLEDKLKDKPEGNVVVDTLPETDKKPGIPSGSTDKKGGKLLDVAGDVVIVPKGASGVVLVRSDRQNYKRKILDFAEEYSRVLAVTFGVSAFLFNLGSTTVLNKRSLIWSGMAVVIIVVTFLVYHDREKLFNTEVLKNEQNIKK